jgi:hypothetical protein
MALLDDPDGGEELSLEHRTEAELPADEGATGQHSQDEHC